MPLLGPTGLVGYGITSECDESRHDGLLIFASTRNLAMAGAAIFYGGLVLHVVLHFVLRRLLRVAWTSFVLTKRSVLKGVSRAMFVRDTAIEVQGVLVHGVLGPAALYLAWASAAEQHANESTLSTYPGITTESCKLYFKIIVIGYAFGSWALFQVLCLLLGWESGAVKWFHHLLFLFTVVYPTAHAIVTELGIFAIAMELSTPALCILSIFRQVEGHATTTARAKIVFASLFFFSRILVFGYGLSRSFSLWYDPPSPAYLEALEGRTAALVFSQALFSSGYLLQLVWGYGILQQAIQHATRRLSRRT